MKRPAVRQRGGARGARRGACVVPSNPLNGSALAVGVPANDDLDILLPGIARKDD